MAAAGLALVWTAMTDRQTHHARGHTEVKTYVPAPFDEVEGGPSLVEIRLTETFSGDIQGEGTVRAVQAARQDGSATLVGIERVRGSIGDRKGTFLLQVSTRQLGKDIKAEWFVLPGSGTGELKGLRGNGGFQAQLGERGDVWLDYSFE